MDYKLFYLNSMMHYGTYDNNVFSDRHLSYVEYHKHKLNLSLDYSPLKCVINCIIHHPYFKIFNNNYCYAETEKIIEGGYYSIYECNKISSNELWNSFKHKNKESIIDLFNDISMDFDRMQDFYKYYPHDVISELLYCIDNSFILEFYEDGYFVKSMESDIDFHKSIDIVNQLINETKLNTLFITPGHGRPFIYRSSFNNYIILSEYKNIKDDKDFPEKLNKMKNEIKDEIKRTTRDNNINSFNYVVNNYYLQSFVFIDRDFNCVYVKLKYDDNFNVIKRVRYGDNKIIYNVNNDLIKHELKLFTDTGITDYYYDDNFCKIDLVCYVNKQWISQF